MRFTPKGGDKIVSPDRDFQIDDPVLQKEIAQERFPRGAIDLIFFLVLTAGVLSCAWYRLYSLWTASAVVVLMAIVFLARHILRVRSRSRRRKAYQAARARKAERSSPGA